MQQHLSAQSFLRSARRGVCTVTPLAPPPSDCNNGEQGLLSLNKQYIPAWSALAVVCLRRCAECSSCRFISLSVDYQECTWFSSCNLSALITTDPAAASDFVTGRMPEEKRWIWSGEEMDHSLLQRGGSDGQSASNEANTSAHRYGVAWLTRAAPGHCGKTTGESDCTEGSSGVLPLPSDAFPRPWSGQDSWASGAESCLALCAECARCRYVSVSPRYRDVRRPAADNLECPFPTTLGRN